MTVDTTMGGGPNHFPSTVWDVLTRIKREEAADEFNALVARYWRPIYSFIRTVWKKPVEDAQDLTQEFFATVFDRDFLRSADRRRGNFRKFLLASLRNFLAEDHRARQALKRGGGRAGFSLDAETESGLAELSSPELTPERAFDRAWAADLLRRARERLQAEMLQERKAAQFEIFRRYCLEEETQVSYTDLARELKMSEPEVRHALVNGRARFRAICGQLIQETVQDPGQVDDEMAELFGSWS